MADLESEGEHLLDLLDPAEELRAVVPGLRTSDTDGEEQVLVGVTDRRVLVIGSWRTGSAGRHLNAADATRCVAHVQRRGPLPFLSGHLEFDLDEEALVRLWSRVDDLRDLAGCG